MTISTTANRQDYTGDNCTKVFQFTYKILATTDLDVYVDNCLKTITTDYTVSGAGAATGGNVTFVTAPGCALAVALVRDVPYTQATAYPENNPFPAESHENALDKLTMLVQQVRELTTRTWRFAAGSVRAAAWYIVDEPKASTYPRVKADCSGIEFVTLTACGTYADPVTTKGDLIMGSASGTQERLGIISGYSLHASPDTGRPSWEPAFSVVLTNKFDVTLASGDVGALDMACDRAVVASNIQGCGRIFVAAGASIGDDCLALFQYVGLARNVKAQGTITRGDWIRKSATAQAVESTTVGSNCDRMIPAGTLGVAATTAAGGFVDALLFGFTHHQVPVLDQLTGLALSNGTDATNDIDIALGAAASDDAAIADREIVSLTAALTKQLDAVWAAGSGAGGRFPAGAPPATCDTYHVFVMKNPITNVIDAGFDTSVTGANIPAAFTKKRRIGSVVWDGATIKGVLQDGDYFRWKTPVLDYSLSITTNAWVNASLWVPTDIRVRAFGAAATTTNAQTIGLRPTDATDGNPSQTAAPLGIAHDNAVREAGAFADVLTNTSGVVDINPGGATGTVRLVTYGYIDRRGRG